MDTQKTQNTQSWDQEYIPTLYQAYKQAKDNGYIFDTIESINRDEWSDIASYPPIVRLRDYQKYKNMTFEELLDEFPEMPDIIEEKLTRTMLFWHATRKYILGYNITNIIERLETYNDLSDIGKDLIDKLYPSFVHTAETHYLEPYIISFDKYMDNADTVMDLINDLGYEAPEDVDLRNYFYDLIVFLSKENKR